MQSEVLTYVFGDYKVIAPNVLTFIVTTGLYNN